jgi:hypothetical protein
MLALEALDFVAHSDADDGVGSVRVLYSLPPLLHAVFPPGFLALYEDLTRFGLRAKAASLGLQEAWRALRGGGRGGGARDSAGSSSSGGAVSGPLPPPGPKGPRSPQRTAAAARAAMCERILLPALLLRSRLQFIVDALLYHLHVDCIAAQCGALDECLGSATLFTEAVAGVEAHTRALLSASLLGQPSVAACLLRLLGHAERFVGLVGGGVERGGAAGAAALLGGETGRLLLRDLAQAVDRDVRYVTGSQFAGGAAGESLASGLLARLCFNDVY